MEAAERREKKTRAKREAILRAAAVAFRRNGYHGTSMEDISEQLLMTKGSLYYYFQDKEAILFACHDFSLDLVIERMKLALKQHTSPTLQLRGVVKGLVDVIIDDLGGSALALDHTALSEDMLAQIIRKRDKFEHGVRKIVKDGVKAGEFRNVDPKLISFALLGSINWISKWYRPDGQYSGDDIEQSFSELFVRGLSPDADSKEK